MEPLKLNVIVVGGGIAGLAAAVVLGRAGHDITVLEKSSVKHEAGYMIIVSFNATRVLDTIDFDYSKAGSVNSDRILAFDGATLEKRYTIPTTTPGYNNSQTRTFYRPDLHSELKRLALTHEKCRSVSLRVGEVVSADIETGIVYLADGTSHSGDLIIGADGEHSIVKSAFKDPDTLRKAQYRIFRCLVPTERLHDKSSQDMLALTRGTFSMFVKDKKTMFWFEGRDGLLQDLETGYVPTEQEDMKLELDPRKAKAKMLRLFHDYHPDIVSSLQKATTVSEWEVSYFPTPHPRIQTHKVLLIGDAAHSMFPTTGQGGSQTIEDVGALSILFQDITSTRMLQERMRLYEKVRKERTEIVMSLSAILYGTEKEFADKRPWHGIWKTGIRSGVDHIRFLYDYDVLEESRKAIAEESMTRARL